MTSFGSLLGWLVRGLLHGVPGYGCGRYATFRLALLVAGFAMVSSFCAGAFTNMAIVTAGPITKITVGEDGSLQVLHVDYSNHGQFFPSPAEPGDSGFFIRHNGTVIGMDYLSHSATAATGLGARPFHPVSQTLSPDGLQVTTVMDTGTDVSGPIFTVNQLTTYKPGDPWFLVQNAVQNQGASDQTVDLFAAADIYLANEDRGYGYLSPDCPQAVGGSNSNRAFNIILQTAPGSLPPTLFEEAGYDEIWRLIGTGAHFENTISTDYIDNGAGLEWPSVTIPAGGTCTVAYYWAFGNLTCVTNASIAGAAFNDVNHDAVWDAGEPPLTNWTIRLSSGQTALTETNGQYFFWVWPGAYTVSQDHPPGWFQTVPDSAGPYTIDLVLGQCTNLNFASFQPPPPGQQPIDPPALNGSNVILHWGYAGWKLQQTTNLVNGPWQEVPIPLSTNGATIPIGANPQMFFRLVNP